MSQRDEAVAALREAAGNALKMMQAWQTDWEALAEDPEYDLQFNQDTIALEKALTTFDALPPDPACEHPNQRLLDGRAASLFPNGWCPDCGAAWIEGKWTLPKSRPTQERGPTGAISLRGFSATKDRLIAEVRDSERITARDLAVTVGPVPPPPAQTVDPVALADLLERLANLIEGQCRDRAVAHEDHTNCNRLASEARARAKELRG